MSAAAGNRSSHSRSRPPQQMTLVTPRQLQSPADLPAICPDRRIMGHCSPPVHQMAKHLFDFLILLPGLFQIRPAGCGDAVVAAGPAGRCFVMHRLHIALLLQSINYRFATKTTSSTLALEPVQYLNVCGLARRFTVSQGVRPKEYRMYFEAEQRRVAWNPPSKPCAGRCCTGSYTYSSVPPGAWGRGPSIPRRLRPLSYALAIVPGKAGADQLVRAGFSELIITDCSTRRRYIPGRRPSRGCHWSCHSPPEKWPPPRCRRGCGRRGYLYSAHSAHCRLPFRRPVR